MLQMALFHSWLWLSNIPIHYYIYKLPPWLSSEDSACQCRRHRFDPWVRKIPWRRKWQPIPAFLPGKIPWTEEAGVLQSTGSQRVRHDWACVHAHMCCGSYWNPRALSCVGCGGTDGSLAPASREREQPWGSDNDLLCYAHGMFRHLA